MDWGRVGLWHYLGGANGWDSAWITRIILASIQWGRRRETAKNLCVQFNHIRDFTVFRGILAKCFCRCGDHSGNQCLSWWASMQHSPATWALAWDGTATFRPGQDMPVLLASPQTVVSPSLVHSATLVPSSIVATEWVTRWQGFWKRLNIVCWIIFYRFKLCLQNWITLFFYCHWRKAGHWKDIRNVNFTIKCNFDTQCFEIPHNFCLFCSQFSLTTLLLPFQPVIGTNKAMHESKRRERGEGRGKM